MGDIFFSIAIPTYGYNGMGGEFLDFSLSIIKKQTFKDFEVVVSDHSEDSTIEAICLKYSNDIRIVYLKNEKGRGITSPNINNAILNCKGKWIKILFQDDFLFDENSLKIIAENINQDTKWIATSFFHSNDGLTMYRPFIPSWNDNIWTGYNTMGCPSILTIQNEKENVLFDDNLNWLMDVDFYKNMFIKYGKPTIINNITVVNRTWGKRLTDTMPQEIKDAEYKYVLNKYNEGKPN